VESANNTVDVQHFIEPPIRNTQKPDFILKSQNTPKFENSRPSGREALPIFPNKELILETLNSNQVVIVSGDTGSG